MNQTQSERERDREFRKACYSTITTFPFISFISFFFILLSSFYHTLFFPLSFFLYFCNRVYFRSSFLYYLFFPIFLPFLLSFSVCDFSFSSSLQLLCSLLFNVCYSMPLHLFRSYFFLCLLSSPSFSLFFSSFTFISFFHYFIPYFHSFFSTFVSFTLLPFFAFFTFTLWLLSECFFFPCFCLSFFVSSGRFFCLVPFLLLFSAF